MSNDFDSEFNSYLELDSSEFNSVNASPAGKSSLVHQASAANSASIFQSSQHAFAAPSYAYESHRQQTGLPVGGLAQTFAVNQAAGFQYRPNSMGFVLPTETLNVPLVNNFDEFDFSRDMEFDADSPSDVSGALYTAAESSSAPVQRMYPGMHKAAQVQRQQELLRQQQQQQQQQLQQQREHIPGQRPLPTQAPKASSSKDPHVEESISRILNRMRQGSTASLEDGGDPTLTGMSNMPKLKKEEADMDEDERLLASEEGKKLSSKERRQLRNKVSARAFRSRRKEYITQLEGELQQKVQESNDLRVQNRQLAEENARLTDLTRMLLSSQSFSGFLHELSQSGGSLPVTTATSGSSHTLAQQPSRKDLSAHEAARQLHNQNLQVGMTMVPEPKVDMQQLEVANGWAAVPSNDFQVYAVTALPPPPVLDFEAMSGKRNSEAPTVSKDVPVLSSVPAMTYSAEMAETTESRVDESIPLDKKTFDLYFDPVTPLAASLPSAEALVTSLRKPISTNTSQIAAQNMDAGNYLEQRCAQLDEICERISNFLS